MRNKIEHQQQDIIEAVVAGRTQSNILNYEEALVGFFGADEGLSDSLRLPIFLSTLTEDAAQAVKRARELLPTSVRAFIADFDNDLSTAVLQHPRFDLRMYLVPTVGAKTDADAALEFVRFDELTEEEKVAISEMRSVIVRERQVSVLLKDCLMPGTVAQQVQAAIPYRFAAASHHARSWQHFKVRPPSGATHPERTDDRYCLYSEPQRTYVYRLAWVRKLIAELATAESFKAVTGCDPVLKNHTTG